MNDRWGIPARLTRPDSVHRLLDGTEVAWDDMTEEQREVAARIDRAYRSGRRAAENKESLNEILATTTPGLKRSVEIGYQDYED